MPIYRGFKVENIVTVDKLYNIYVAQHDAGYFFPGESHDFWECSYCLKGKTCVGADEKIYHLQPGDFMCFKPMGFHTFMESDVDATVLTLSFGASGEIMDFFSDKLFTLSDDQKEILDSIYELLDTEFELDFPVPKKTTYHRFFVPSPIKLQLAATYITQLLISIRTNSTIAPASESTDAKIFKKAIDYMNKNIYAQISTPDISAHCGISQSGLKRLFAKSTGYPIHKYFLKMKLTAASLCLKNGENITRTAMKFGFPSQSYFSVVFKREMGISPTEFKLHYEKDK